MFADALTVKVNQLWAQTQSWHQDQYQSGTWLPPVLLAALAASGYSWMLLAASGCRTSQCTWRWLGRKQMMGDVCISNKNMTWRWNSANDKKTRMEVREEV